MKKSTSKSLLISAVIACLFSVLIFGTASQVMATGPTVKWVNATNGDDTNNGNTEATAYQTLQTAIDASHSGTSDADRSYIYVKDGTYSSTGQTSCEGFPAAVAIDNLDYLTIQAAPGANPVVKPATAVESDIVSIGINNSNHLVIDNIDSDQTIAQFDNWHVCNSDDLTVRNSRFEGGEDGIDFGGTGFTGALIENNEFIDISTGSGDEVLDFTDGAYADVTIQDNLFENNYRQITIHPPTTGQATNFVIRRNVMNGTTSQEAVRLIGPNDVTLENNVIINSTQQGLYIDSGTSNVNVWHNTFFSNGEEEIRTKVDSADIVIKNNIIYANGTHAAIAASTAPLPSEDFNLVFNDGTNTESGSQPAVTSFGANTITSQDPLFVSTTAGAEDLHLHVGSPALEAGTDLSVAEDLEQNLRPNPVGSAPDLGTYEMGVFDEEGPIISNVLADPNPVAVNTAVLLTANIDDTTTGGSNIDFAEYSINGGAWVPMDAQDGAFDKVSEDVEATVPAFTTPEVFEICVRGTDAPGNVGAEECIFLAVYDPDAGFVTGGGWLESPSGAYYPDAYHPAAGVTVVTSADVGMSWLSPDLRGDGYVDFVEGPETPPLGVGSLEMGTASASDKAQLFNYQHIGTSLVDIEGISYATYRDSSSTNSSDQYPALNIEVDYLGDDSSYTTLVWEPLYAYGQSNLAVDSWQTWDTMAPSQTSFGGGWWSTKDIPGVCAFNCFVDWSTIISNNPDAKISGAFGVNVGSGWNGVFTGNIDALSLTVAGDTTTYDFEPYPPASDPVGKANFGFVSKYKKGANVPTGNTQFVFKAADLNFHSNTYEWLVVTGNNTAKFKGEGTVNGTLAPNDELFKFQLWAGDGTGQNGEDTFRIRIWWEDGDGEHVVYDNGMDQAIGGGNIVIHKK